jgi:hypothetical protein
MSTLISTLRKNPLLVVLAFLAAALLVGALWILSARNMEAASADAAGSDISEAVVASDPTDDAASTGTSGTVVAVSPTIARVEFGELVGQSSLVVRGTVSGEPDMLLIQGVGGGDPVYYTNTCFNVAEIYRGEASEAGEAEITIRELCTSYLNEDGSLAEGLPSNATLLPDKEYVLFLYAPNYGGGWNTADDYFQVVGFNQGAFLREEGDVFRNLSYEEAIHGGTFADEMAAANAETPIDYDFHKNLLEEGLNANRESGFITEEQYNQAVEERGLYATVVG